MRMLYYVIESIECVETKTKYFKAVHRVGCCASQNRDPPRTKALTRAPEPGPDLPTLSIN